MLEKYKADNPQNANYSLWYTLYTKGSFVQTLVSNDFRT